MLTALAGGVGAARFLRGLMDVVDETEVTVVVNTGDDDRFHGLHVSPDLDSVTYALADANNPDTGWGLAGETFRTMEALDRYGVATWFRLGDRDLATHLYRTDHLDSGRPLSAVTTDVIAAWGLRCRLVPMTDDAVRTRITVRRADGSTEELAMQEWFVRERAESPVVSVRFDGADEARPAPGVIESLEEADTILVCPSNPVISIGPILAVPGIRDVLVRRRDRVVGVSPIIAGRAVRGPADRLMAALGLAPSCVGVAAAYRDFCGTFVVDDADRRHVAEIKALGLQVVVTDTIMRDARVAAALARDTLAAVA